MAGFLGGTSFTPVSIVAPENSTLVFPLNLFWFVDAAASVFSCAYMAFMITFIYSNCAITAMSKLVSTALDFSSPSSSWIWIYISWNILLMWLIDSWCSSGGGGRYTVDVLHCHGVSPFPCGCYQFLLLAVGLVKEDLEFWSCILVGALKLPHPGVFVEYRRLCQKGDTFWHHHGFGNCLLPCLRELSPLFQFFYKLGQGFRGFLGPHHIDSIFL